MTRKDLELLNDRELEIVDNSFDEDGGWIRFRNSFLVAFGVAAMLVVLFEAGASNGIVLMAFGGFLIVSTVEKLTYVRYQMDSRGAMRRLIHRLERVEQVPLTPVNARPSQKLAMPRQVA